MPEQPRSESGELRRRDDSGRTGVVMSNGSRRRGEPERPRKLRRVEANNLVIYTTEPEVPIASEELLPTEEELVSAGPLVIIPIVIAGAGLLLAIATFVRK